MIQFIATITAVLALLKLAGAIQITWWLVLAPLLAWLALPVVLLTPLIVLAGLGFLVKSLELISNLFKK